MASTGCDLRLTDPAMRRGGMGLSSCQTTNRGHTAPLVQRLINRHPLRSCVRCHSGGSVVDVTVSLLAADPTHVAPIGRRP
jgi:hypothetical protein